MKQRGSVLIVDDDEDILLAAEVLLSMHFDRVDTCPSPEAIPARMAAQRYDAILLDMNFAPELRSGEQGFYWLEQILARDSDAVVILITAHAGVDVAVRAMKCGATDFICKPWENQKLLATLGAAVQLRRSRAEAAQLKSSNQALVEASSSGDHSLIGESPAMTQLRSMIARAAPTEANVLILGENGSGKELVARALHQQSLRAESVFLSVDLGAVSETLFESELFGHVKGAFTGAAKARTGRLVAASGGTLFLDEIGNIPLHLQAKLLTVLAQRQVMPLGSNEAVDIDVRVIAATNVPRERLRDESHFRQDLLFRLNTVEILVPPLRERLEDIPRIAAHYAQFYARKYRRPERPLSLSALEQARRDPWLGNVRALRHAIERAVIMAEGDTIEAVDLQLQPVAVESQVESSDGETAVTIDVDENLNLEVMERRLVEAALRKHGFNISKAAAELGLTRATLYRRMEKYGF